MGWKLLQKMAETEIIITLKGGHYDM